MGSAKELFYEFLRWGPRQYEALAKVLPTCYSLETLHLNGNCAGNAGAEAIAAVLHCTTITRLEMCGNNLDARGVGVLRSPQMHCLGSARCLLGPIPFSQTT